MYETITPESIKQAILSGLKTDLQTNEGSLIGDLIGPVALELYKVYQSLNELAPMVYVDETSGRFIDQRCAYYGIRRKQGQKAETAVWVSTEGSVTVPKGFVFTTASGLGFVTQETMTIMSGSGASIQVAAEEAGARYNVAADTITGMRSPLQGITGVTNPAAAQGGTDPETDAELVNRLYAFLQKPATSGNIHHYEQWALECPGVSAAKVSAGDQAGSVEVLIAGSGMQPVDEEVKNACAAYIETQRPIGATVTVKSAAANTIGVTATVTLAGTAALEDIVKRFRERLAGYFADIAFTANPVSYNRILYILMDVDGVKEVAGLLVNGGQANIQNAENQPPVVGEVEINGQSFDTEIR